MAVLFGSQAAPLHAVAQGMWTSEEAAPVPQPCLVCSASAELFIFCMAYRWTLLATTAAPSPTCSRWGPPVAARSCLAQRMQQQSELSFGSHIC